MEYTDKQWKKYKEKYEDNNLDRAKIVCKNNNNGTYALTIGKEYELDGFYTERGEIKKLYIHQNDLGEYTKYIKEFFDIPKEYIEKYGILNETPDVCLNCETIIKGFTRQDKDNNNYCGRCFNELFVSCQECSGHIKIDEAQNFTKIQGVIRGYLCIPCYKRILMEGYELKTCKCCKKPLFTDKNKEVCPKCENPRYTIMSKMFNKHFREQDIECTCSEEDLDSNDGDCTCEASEEVDFYHNNINPLSSVTNKQKEIRTIGIELEVIPRKEYGLLKASQYLKQELHSRKYKNLRYDELIIIKEDGSLSREGIEINSVVFDTSPSTMKVLREILQIIEKYFTADKTCGLHVHYGAKDLNDTELKRIHFLYQRLEPVMYNFVAENRKHNRYCNHIARHKHNDYKTKDFRNLAILRDRYRAVNFSALQKYGTIEIRLMDGNTNTERILEWIRFHNKIIDYAIKTETLIEDVKKTTMGLIRKVLGDELYESYKTLKSYKRFLKKGTKKTIEVK